MASRQTQPNDVLGFEAAVPGLVSIVIPCYGGEKYLAEAIESCLCQTYRNIEVIVVDDASPDACAAIGIRFAEADPRVRVVQCARNGGVSRAFNAGFASAQGEFFARLAQDDAFEPHAVEMMVARLRSDAQLALVYADFSICDESGSFVRAAETPPPGIALQTRNQVGLCIIWRREVWRRLGGFDPAFDTVEDFEYLLRATREFAMGKAPGPAALRMRIHGEMASLRQLLRQNALSRKAIKKWSRIASGPHPIRRRIALAYADYAASIGYSEQGRILSAFGRLASSFFIWPLPLPNETEPIPLARGKLLVVSLLRLLRLRGTRP